MRMLPIILIIFIAAEAFSDELLEAQQKVLAPFSNHPQYKPLENKLTTLSTELDSINKQLQLLNNRTNTFIPRVEKAQSAEEFRQLCIDILKCSTDKGQFIARINEIVIEGSLLIYNFLANAMQDTLVSETPRPEITMPTSPTSVSTMEHGKQAKVSISQKSISFEELDSMFGIDSPYTDYQKENLWKEYKGQYVEWVGEVTYVNENWFSGLTVGFRHKQTTSSYDVQVDFPDEYKSVFLAIPKGTFVRYRGCLESYGGAFMPYSLKDGNSQ